MSSPCQGCGACCATQGTPPFTWSEDDRPPPDLVWDLDAEAQRYDYNLPCLWYDEVSKTCRHYDRRPQVCREFEVAAEDCQLFREGVGLSRITLL
jgi:uncharacterized protein